MGAIEPFDFESYATVVERFQSEWQDLVRSNKGKEI